MNIVLYWKSLHYQKLFQYTWNCFQRCCNDANAFAFKIRLAFYNYRRRDLQKEILEVTKQMHLGARCLLYSVSGNCVVSNGFLLSNKSSRQLAGYVIQNLYFYFSCIVCLDHVPASSITGGYLVQWQRAKLSIRSGSRKFWWGGGGGYGFTQSTS